MQRQILADGILGAGQRQRSFSHRCLPRGQVKTDPAAHQPMHRGAVLPPQMRRHPGTQLCHPERLCKVIVCPDAQPLQNRRFVCPGRQKQNGGIGQAPDAAADGKAILPGHHHIQQDAVRPAAELFGELCAGESCFHPVAVPLQGSADQLAEFYIVIHCQNICHKITSKRYKQGRMPHTADTHGPGRTSRIAVYARCRADRCTAASAGPQTRRTTRNRW